MEIRINVPYFSQYQELKDKVFALTSCGMVCLFMALSYYSRKKIISFEKDLEEMVMSGRETEGGYKPGVGWIHDYFVATAENYGLKPYRKEKIETFDEIIESIKKENPVIVSVERRCLTAVSLHMVLLTGIKTGDDAVEGFFYHDPASLVEKDGSHRFCTTEQLKTYWREKAIFFLP